MRPGTRKFEQLSPTESEEYLFGLTPATEQETIRSNWTEIESRLFGLLATMQNQPDRRDVAFRMIQRGRHLFGLGPGSDPASMHILLQKGGAATDPSERSVYRDAWLVYRHATPVARADHGKLKAQLYYVADFWPNRPVRLKSTFLDVVGLKYPFVRRLPGHEPGAVRAGRTVTADAFSPLLQRLLHRNVFSKFAFLERAA